jgi:hypothetical protein
MTPLAIAHRAGNSLAGLHAANALGVDVIECDVHEHRGRLEVRHLKTAGPLPFLWDRWELASAAAPRLGLHELLTADEHGTTFMLDIKGRRASTARSVASLLHDTGHDRPVLACGRWWPAVDLLAELPFVQPVLSARKPGELARLRRRAAPARRRRDDLAGQRPGHTRVHARDRGHRRDQRRGPRPGRVTGYLDWPACLPPPPPSPSTAWRCGTATRSRWTSSP